MLTGWKARCSVCRAPGSGAARHFVGRLAQGRVGFQPVSEADPEEPGGRRIRRCYGEGAWTVIAARTSRALPALGSNPVSVRRSANGGEPLLLKKYALRSESRLWREHLPKLRCVGRRLFNNIWIIQQSIDNPAEH
jgi:hypothetical protein